MHTAPGSCLYLSHPGGNQALLLAGSYRPPARPGVTRIEVTSRGAERWVRGHPWIFRSEVKGGTAEPGLVEVVDSRGRFLGQALYSPRSEIRLRLLERSDRPVDAAWWCERLEASAARRGAIDA